MHINQRKREWPIFLCLYLTNSKYYIPWVSYTAIVYCCCCWNDSLQQLLLQFINECLNKLSHQVALLRQSDRLAIALPHTTNKSIRHLTNCQRKADVVLFFLLLLLLSFRCCCDIFRCRQYFVKQQRVLGPTNCCKVQNPHPKKNTYEINQCHFIIVISSFYLILAQIRCRMNVLSRF